MEILIWGAGKIGRGFIGDIFYNAGYKLIFVDVNETLVNKLNEQKYYTVFSLYPDGKEKANKISGIEAIHISDLEKIQKKLSRTDLLAISTFPEAYGDVARVIADEILQRESQSNNKKLDILLCANILNPSTIFLEQLNQHLTENGTRYLSESCGLIETLLMRIAIQPDQKYIAKDSLCVVTNGFPYLPLDIKNFKGTPPEIKELQYTDRIEQEEIRKIYTYNMIHAVFAYAGAAKGYKYISQCIEDDEIIILAKECLNEVRLGLQHEYGFTEEEMRTWNEEVLYNMTNPVLQDTIARVGANPLRKLSRNDRLVGPALICRKNGNLPYYLSLAIACGYLFNTEDDTGAAELQRMIADKGIKTAIKEVSAINPEKDLIWMIERLYGHVKSGKLLSADPKVIDLLKDAFKEGFAYEKTYRGCAQCALGALYKITGKKHDMLFQASTAFSGGMALSGDGSCGGYSGGILFLGTYVGRRLENVSGDKIAQYKAYELSIKLREKFIETYGTVTCSKIHEETFGRAYILRDKPVRDAFEEAGAHIDKCTTVVGMATMWVMEILLDEKIIKL